MRLCALVLLLLAVVLAACDPLSLPQATPTPQPTATLSPIPATDTPVPTDTPVSTDTPQATDTPEPQVAATDTPPAAAGTSGTPNAELQRELEQVESDTVKIRGLQPKAAVNAQFIPQSQMKK